MKFKVNDKVSWDINHAADGALHLQGTGTILGDTPNNDDEQMYIVLLDNPKTVRAMVFIERLLSRKFVATDVRHQTIGENLIKVIKTIVYNTMLLPNATTKEDVGFYPSEKQIIIDAFDFILNEIPLIKT